MKPRDIRSWILHHPKPETLLVTSSRCFFLGVLDAVGGRQGKFIEPAGQVTGKTGLLILRYLAH